MLVHECIPAEKDMFWKDEVIAIFYSCLCIIVQQIKCENRMQVREDPLWMVAHVIIEATMQVNYIL